MKFTLISLKAPGPGRTCCLVALLLALVNVPQSAEGVTLAVSQVLDENVNQGNVIDSQAPGNAISSTLFAAAVSSAFTAGTGGVINFDTAGDTANVPYSDPLSISYGSGKSFNITSSSSYNVHQFFSLTSISGNGTTGGNKGIASAVTNITDWTLSFDAITGGSPLEAITTAGFALLSRNGFSQDVIVNWFVDGGVAPYLAQEDNIGSGGGADDTFFSFTAPTGGSITGVQVIFGGATGSNDRRLGIDDFAFTTSNVPEPSRVILLGMALVGGVLRRRR
jgi:hypothetical protein